MNINYIGIFHIVQNGQIDMGSYKLSWLIFIVLYSQNNLSHTLLINEFYIPSKSIPQNSLIVKPALLIHSSFIYLQYMMCKTTLVSSYMLTLTTVIHSFFM